MMLSTEESVQIKESLTYLHGFGNEFQSEAPGFEGALPRTINAQALECGLIAEQLSGSAFTAPRASNKRSWLYRKKPSVCHEPFERLGQIHQLKFGSGYAVPQQTRWEPFTCHSKLGDEPRTDFVMGLQPLAFSDKDGSAQSSITIYVYLFDCPMPNKSFVNTDGDFLIVPQKGALKIRTEFGKIDLQPNQIAVIQQGMKFSVDPVPGEREFTRGYVLEVRGNHFELPNLGPIGANGLANPRDFEIPTAWIEQNNYHYEVIWKFQNELFTTRQSHSPYDVGAWFGNYTPYKYDLDKFVSLNSVSVDHPDPSIFTVLTSPSIGKPGTALADFVIFPPRWECATNTFRPPYFHRNCMTEFMGLIKGQYQAKSGKFAPGGASLHHAMIPHGPDYECYKNATQQDTSTPKRVADDTMAFMFETSLSLKISDWAKLQKMDTNYHRCWQGIGDSN